MSQLAQGTGFSLEDLVGICRELAQIQAFYGYNLTIFKLTLVNGTQTGSTDDVV
jgi:hypothetical protein